MLSSLVGGGRGGKSPSGSSYLCPQSVQAQACGREWHKLVVAVFSVVMECCAAKRRWSREKALTLLSWLLDVLMQDKELVTQPRSW